MNKHLPQSDFKTPEVTTGPLPSSRKVYVAGELHKDIAVPVQAASKMTAEQLEGKILTGVLFKEDRPEYCEQYAQVISRAQGA